MKKNDAHNLRQHNGRATSAHANQASKRERILAAGLKLFAHQPFQAVTMDRVAKAANVAKGTLYLYFSSKEALYLGILSDGLETVARNYQSSVEPGADARERLRRAISVGIQFYDQRRDLLCLLATEEPRLAEARNRLIQGWRDRGFKFYTSLIEEGMHEGIFGKCDSRLATLAILGAVRWVLLYYGSNRPVADLSGDLAQILLRGLATDAPHQARAAHVS